MPGIEEKQFFPKQRNFSTAKEPLRSTGQWQQKLETLDEKMSRLLLISERQKGENLSLESGRELPPQERGKRGEKEGGPLLSAAPSVRTSKRKGKE